MVPFFGYRRLRRVRPLSASGAGPGVRVARRDLSSAPESPRFPGPQARDPAGAPPERTGAGEQARRPRLGVATPVNGRRTTHSHQGFHSTSAVGVALNVASTAQPPSTIGSR